MKRVLTFVTGGNLKFDIQTVISLNQIGFTRKAKPDYQHRLVINYQPVVLTMSSNHASVSIAQLASLAQATHGYSTETG